MSPQLYLLSLILPLATLLLIFGMRYFAILQRAKAELAHQEAYRKVAEQAAGAEAETSAALADIRARLTAIEQVLKDVG